MLRTGALLVTLLVLPWLAAAAGAQELPSRVPVLVPAEPEPRSPADNVVVIPLTTATSRAAAAGRSQARVASVLPPSWTSITARYQPVWDTAGGAAGFGLERWSSYFAAAGIVPWVAPHPFLSPWGMLSYDGWLFDRYRSAWSPPAEAPERMVGASEWLQRADRSMAEGRVPEAAEAYRRVTQAAPEFALGWLGLGAALAETGDAAAAAGAFRQGLERYPAWLAPALDWESLYAGPERLLSVQSAAAARAAAGDADAGFVAGVLHLFGGAPATGRRLLSGSPDDPHAALLLSRGPR